MADESRAWQMVGNAHDAMAEQMRQVRKNLDREANASVWEGTWDLRPRFMRRIQSKFQDVRDDLETMATNHRLKAEARLRRTWMDSVHLGVTDADDDTAAWIKGQLGSLYPDQCKVVMASFEDSRGRVEVPVVRDAGATARHGDDARADVMVTACLEGAVACSGGEPDMEALSKYMRAALVCSGNDASVVRDNMVAVMMACQAYGVEGYDAKPPLSPEDLGQRVDAMLKATGACDAHTRGMGAPVHVDDDTKALYEKACKSATEKADETDKTEEHQSEDRTEKADGGRQDEAMPDGSGNGSDEYENESENAANEPATDSADAGGKAEKDEPTSDSTDADDSTKESEPANAGSDVPAGTGSKSEAAGLDAGDSSPEGAYGEQVQWPQHMREVSTDPIPAVPVVPGQMTIEFPTATEPEATASDDDETIDY